MAKLNEELHQMPGDVWDDPRNARAAVMFVLSGGHPRLIKDLLGRSSPLPIDEKLLNAALAYGEARVADATELLADIDHRQLEPGLAGLVALIKGTLLTRTDAKKAVALFDDARILSQGTLIEESALRQEILLVASEGNMARFDQLSSQYSRRFGNSIYAANFRRQFFAGVARQDFAGTSEWIARTETELQKIAPSERASAYLSIAHEAALGGNVEIARYAAGHAAELLRNGSTDHARAKLYEGAALIITDDYEKGEAALRSIPAEKLRDTDRELLDAARLVSSEVRRWPEAPAESQEPLPASVTRAESSLSNLDSILAGSSQ
jgi:chemotaxis protein MotC